MIRILFVILIFVVSGASYSATIYSINSNENNIKVVSVYISEDIKAKGNVVKLLVSGEVIKTATVVDIIEDRKLILQLEDVSGLFLGQELTLLTENSESFKKVVRENSEKNINGFGSPENYNYKLSTDGLRNYLDDELYNNDLGLYNKLNSELILLESRKSFSMLSTLAGAVVGGVMMSIGKAADENDDLSQDQKDRGAAIGLQGAIIALVGVGIGSALKPKKSEVIDFIKKHNRLNIDNELKLNGTQEIAAKVNRYVNQFALLGGADSFSVNYTYRF